MKGKKKCYTPPFSAKPPKSTSVRNQSNNILLKTQMFYAPPFATREQKHQKSLAVKRCCYETLSKSHTLVPVPGGKPAERCRVSSGTVPDCGVQTTIPTSRVSPGLTCAASHLPSLESTEATVRLFCVYGLGLDPIL